MFRARDKRERPSNQVQESAGPDFPNGGKRAALDLKKSIGGISRDFP